MGGDYILETSAAPSRVEKFLKVFIVLAIVCMAGEMVWLLGISPFRPFSRINISGGETHSYWAKTETPLYFGISREEILSKAGIGDAASYFSSDVKAMENALMEIPSFESVRVLKYFPGRLHIVLEGRRPVATALASFNGQTIPVLFDSYGVIFETAGTGSSGNRQAGNLSAYGTLPVVSGLIIDDPYPGMKLPALFVPFLKDLEKISLSSPLLLSTVSEFRISRKAFDGFDLVVYPAHKKIKVLLSELNEDMLRYALLMVDVLSVRGGGIDTLDFRSGIASYIPKEAYSE